MLQGVAENGSLNDESADIDWMKEVGGETDSGTILNENEEGTADEEDVSINAVEIMKMSSHEWHLILIASFSAIIVGLIQPSFALLLTEIIGVSIHYIYKYTCPRYVTHMS